jgi:ribonucleotide reductase beta subunit family protein with ferritin-like domain
MTTERLEEPLLTEDNTRFTQLPIKYPELQKAYETHESMFWSSKEIDYPADLADWNSLSDDERYFIEHILAFFSGADGIVLENLVNNFCSEIKASEARNFYSFQAMIENVHALTYALLLDTLVKDPKRKHELFNAIDTIPCVRKKADWALKWMNNKRPFEERIIAFSIVEGVFFSGAFCAIFWLKSRNKMVKALGTSNELIARDEALHCAFAVLIYNHLKNRVTQQRVEEILIEAVNIEKEFICESIPCAMLGMNKDLMSTYIEYVADTLLVQLGFEKIYNSENPFEFMTAICLDGKTNFFESRTTAYVSANTLVSGEESWNKIDFGSF